MSEPLFPRLDRPDDGEAIRIGDATLSYAELAGAAAGVGGRHVVLHQVIGKIGEPRESLT